MANIAIFRINYKSDFILTLNSDAGWMTPFCIKFWTGAPSQAYFVGYDGTTYTHCAPVAGDPTKLEVQFDDHHLPIGDLKFQIGYHFTVADFPTSVEDEVINQEAVIIDQDGTPMQVMLDLNGETAPEIQFALPAYANEAQRIANEQQRIANEEQRIADEQTRIQHEEARIAAEQTRQQNEQQRINQEQARVNEYARLKADAVAATGAANDAAALANQKAQLAADKAALAQAAADLANAKAQLATDKAALAASAAQLANDKAALAQQKAEYAQTQGGYAKDQGDYAKDQGDYAKAQGDYAKDQGDYAKAKCDYAKDQGDYAKEQGDYAKDKGDICAADHLVAVEDHQTAAADHQTATTDHSTALSDHTQAGNDHTRAESDHDAVELYVDSLGVFDLSKHNAVGGVLATYADLDAALTALNALESKYKYGGMSFKFVQSFDNKYMQARCMTQNFTTDVTQWQSVDDEPFAGSENLVDGAGVSKYVGDFVPYIKTVKNYASAHNGRALTANGLSIEDENCSLLDYAVNAGEFIYVSLSKDSDGVCQFQSASFVPSSGTNMNLIGNTITAECNGVIRVPEGATYLIVSQLSTNETNKVYSCSNSVDTTVTKNSKNLLTSGAAYNSIKDNLKDVLPLPEYPWIKELYINEAGVAAGALMLHSIVPLNGRINFANAQGSAYTARLTFTDAIGIYNIVDWSTQTTILGYCLIDGVVGKQQNESTPLVVLDEKQKSLYYSPSIKAKLLNEYIDVQDGVLDYDIDKVLSLMYENEEGDKDFSLLTSSATNDSVVFIQYPKNKKQCTVNRITFKAKQGTTKFYLVTVGTTCTCSLITEINTVLADNGKIKHVDLNNPITLSQNQYIGISGALFFGLEDNAQGFQGANVTISTGAISAKNTIALGYILENTENIFGRLEDLEEKDLYVNISSFGTTVGETINNPARIITLAADGTGYYSDFPAAVSACISAGNATLVIKQGVYNIPVRTTGDYAIAFDIVGIGNPILKCINDATGDDFLDIKQNFSPFRILSTHDAHKTIKVEGITLIAKDVRYCVHDELGALNQPSYTHIFKNCNFMHLSDPDQDWASPRCIGGGLGNHGLILIENCEFKSGILTSVDYHEGYGGNQQSSKVIVKDCVLANNTVSCTTISTISEKSVMVVQNCILKALPICNDYQGRIDVELVEKDNILV